MSFRSRLLNRMNILLPFLLLLWPTKSFSQKTQIDAEDNDSLKFSENLYSNSNNREQINVFYPKMDYEDWTPLGRGDPLKNDPTYDYVPPVLDRVQYWMDPDKRTPDPPLPNSPSILFLEPKTKPSPPSPLPIWKQPDSRLDASSFLDPLLKLIETPQHNPNATPNTYKPLRHAVKRPHHQNLKQQRDHMIHTHKTPPHTILMPPPLPSPSVRPLTTLPPFQLTTNHDRPPKTPTSPAPATPLDQITTTTPPMIPNTENLFGPVAILMPTHLTQTNVEPDNKPPSTPTTTPSPVHSHLSTIQMPPAPKIPYFLIIEGHSKVKTYGASKNPINGLITSNTISYDDDPPIKPLS